MLTKQQWIAVAPEDPTGQIPRVDVAVPFLGAVCLLSEPAHRLAERVPVGTDVERARAPVVACHVRVGGSPAGRPLTPTTASHPSAHRPSCRGPPTRASRHREEEPGRERDGGRMSGGGHPRRSLIPAQRRRHHACSHRGQALPSAGQESESRVGPRFGSGGQGYLPWQESIRRTAAQAGISQRRLARELGVAESEVWRMLNPEHGTKAATIDHALRRLGKRVTVTVGEAA